MKYHIGQRLSYSGELCTIRFKGEIPTWENQIALGVEWDNPSKGKHSGSYKGIQYFDVLIPNTGSFLKATKKCDPIRDFYTALVNTYADDFQETEIRIGSKVIESLGFDELQRLQSDFNYLKDISLSRKQINSFDLEDLSSVTEGLKNLEKLDLSFNLLEDFNDVVNILKTLNVKRLKLTGNRFKFSKIGGTVASLESIDLSLTYVTDDILEQIPFVFPNLKELHLSDNNFQTMTPAIVNFKNLESLNISLNSLHNFPEMLSQLPNLKTLNISNNSIELLSAPSKPITFTNIKDLDIRRNEINQWREIDALMEQFPNLQILKINHNPLFDKLSIEESEFNIIARIPDLIQLNGVTIIPRERLNAELYFISKVNDDTIIQYSKDRFNELLRLHNKTNLTSKIIINDNTIQSSLIKLQFKFKDEVKILEVLQNIEILKLKGILSRLFGLNFVDLQLSYETGHITSIIEKNVTLVSSFSFEHEQLITVEKITT